MAPTQGFNSPSSEARRKRRASPLHGMTILGETVTAKSLWVDPWHLPGMVNSDKTATEGWTDEDVTPGDLLDVAEGTYLVLCIDPVPVTQLRGVMEKGFIRRPMRIEVRLLFVRTLVP